MKPIIKFIQFENRIKVSLLKKNILFCVPPSIGLGDAIEYCLAINSIKENNLFGYNQTKKKRPNKAAKK